MNSDHSLSVHRLPRVPAPREYGAGLDRRVSRVTTFDECQWNARQGIMTGRCERVHIE